MVSGVLTDYCPSKKLAIEQSTLYRRAYALLILHSICQTTITEKKKETHSMMHGRRQVRQVFDDGAH